MVCNKSSFGIQCCKDFLVLADELVCEVWCASDRGAPGSFISFAVRS